MAAGFRGPLWVALAAFCGPAPAGAPPEPAPPPPAGQETRLDRCLGAPPVHRWELPPLFREVSGLGLAGDGRLLLHNDEQGVLAALDLAGGWILGTYRLGSPPVRDDFEGLAVVGERLFLVTSRGVLYETVVPPPRAERGEYVMPYRVRSTGLDDQCEFEGLAYDSAAGVLLLACKTPKKKSLEDVLAIFRWSVAEERLAEPERIEVPLDDLKKGRPGKRFQASGLDRDPVSGRLVAVAAPDNAIAEFDATGVVVATRALPNRHRQAEGVVVTRDGRLIISDEGGRSGPGSVAIYACR